MFYVYLLIDPRDSKPFYVGKGKGKRARMHEAEARKGLPGAKCKRIRDIWEAGLKVGIEIESEFSEEAEALDRELELIRALPNLTNQIHNDSAPKTYRFSDLMFKVLFGSRQRKAVAALRLCTLFPIEVLEMMPERKLERSIWHKAREIVLENAAELTKLAEAGRI